jgi:hypothetical protein
MTLMGRLLCVAAEGRLVRLGDCKPQAVLRGPSNGGAQKAAHQSSGLRQEGK